MIALRLAAFSFIVFMSYQLPKAQYLVLFLVLLYAHYLQQIVYSPNVMNAMWARSPKANSPTMFVVRLVFLTGLFAIAQFTPYLPIALYFGVHFVLTEVYGQDFYRSNFLERCLHLLSSSSVYALFVHRLEPFNRVPKELYVGLFVAALAGLVFCHFRNRNAGLGRETKNSLKPLIAYEACAVIFLIWGPRHDTQLANIIFYHVAWWAIYPLKKPFEQLLIRRPDLSKKSLKSNEAIYIYTTVAISAALYLMMVQNDRYLLGVLTQDLVLWGNVHITISFALSSSHPDFINRLFDKAPRSIQEPQKYGFHDSQKPGEVRS